MATFQSNDVRLYYTHTHHEGAKLPLIFLHGIGNDTNQGRAIFGQNETVELYCLSQRGHEGSEMGELKHFKLETLGRDVKNFADHLGLEKFYLAGLSMGSAAALSFAARHSERLLGMLLLRPAWAGEGAKMDEETLAFFAFVRDCFDTPKRGLEAFEAGKQTPAYQALNEEKKANYEKFLPLFLAGETHYLSKDKFVEIPKAEPSYGMRHPESIPTRTFVLTNKQDKVHPFHYGEYYQNTMPNCTWREIPCKALDEQAYNEAINNALWELSQN